MERAKEDRRTLDNLSSSLKTLTGQLELFTKKLDVPAVEVEIQRIEGSVREIIMPELREDVTFSRELLAEKAEEKESLQGEIKRAEALIESNRTRINEDTSYLEGHKDVEARLELQTKLVKQLERRAKVIRRAIDAVEKTAESYRNRVSPGVERYMGQILPSITSGRYRAVRLDDDYNLQVWDPEAGEFRAKEVFSGGTEDQFLLGMRLAFALALTPEVKGSRPEFLFLDEPLGSSDEVRRSGILDFLESEMSSKFKQIFLISHVGGLDEDTPVENVIRIENGRVL
jgi:exonuclease SbcC